MASHPVGDPWVLVADVLAEAAGVDPSRSFDAEARALAKTMRGIRWDWGDRPVITWSTAAELLASLKAEHARRQQEMEERLVEQAQAYAASIPKGVPLDAVPPGVDPAQWWMRNDPDWQRQRRRSVLDHALSNSGEIVYTPIRDERAGQ